MLKVSVIVPIYNVEQYLRKCIDSILNQSYSELEVILVDDGSKDSCPEICDEYAVYNNVIVIHKENGGISSAREQGIMTATGDYIMLVDGDDWIDSETVSECVNQIDSNCEIDCVIFSYTREYPGNSIIAHIMDESGMFIDSIAEKKIYRRLFGLLGEELKHPERLENMGSCCMKLYKANVIRNGKYFDTKDVGSSEDVLFNIYALLGCKKFVYLDMPFYHYRKAGNSITSTYRPRLVKQWNHLFDIIESFIDEHGLDARYYMALNNRIALSVLGIGMNEIINESVPYFARVKKIKEYILTERYQNAVKSIDISMMPPGWKTLMLLARYKLATAVSLELSVIQLIRGRH